MDCSSRYTCSLHSHETPRCLSGEGRGVPASGLLRAWHGRHSYRDGSSNWQTSHGVSKHHCARVERSLFSSMTRFVSQLTKKQASQPPASIYSPITPCLQDSPARSSMCSKVSGAVKPPRSRNEAAQVLNHIPAVLSRKRRSATWPRPWDSRCNLEMRQITSISFGLPSPT